MVTTTRVLSVSVPVADQDAALAFYTGVLGFELVTDAQTPAGRLVEVAPPGQDVRVVLVPPGSRLPIAVRLEAPDADAAHAEVVASGTEVHNDEVLRWPGVPAMFSFEDPDGNGVVYLEPGD